MLQRLWFLATILTLILLLNSCDILVNTDGVYIIDQEYITGTWYSEYEVLNPVDTSYKYYDVTIRIDKVTDRDDYTGAWDQKYNYAFAVGELLHLEILEDLPSGSKATTSKGFLWDPVTEYDEEMLYTYTSTLSGGGQWSATFEQTSSNPDSMRIQFGSKSYKGSKEKSINKH